MADFPTQVAAKYDATTPKIPNCSRPLKEGIKVDTILFTADSGHEQRRKKSDPKRTFDPQYTALKKNEYFTIRDHFIEHLNTTPFLWTHPIEGIQYLVRYNMDTFSAENFSHSPIPSIGPLYKLQLNLLQVWA